MALYLQLAIDIARLPRHQWDAAIQALPDAAREPVRRWIAANYPARSRKARTPRHRRP